MNNNIYCVFPAGAQKIKFKNYIGTLFLLGRLYSFWNKKKKPIKIRRTFLLENLTFLSKYTLWLYLKELQTKNVITISKKDYDNDTMIINFTDDFIKNYVNAPASNNVEDCDDCEEITDVTDVTESIEEDEHTEEPLEDDMDTPVEGWAYTSKRIYNSIVSRYGGKVPEIPEEALNFDFGKYKPEEFDIFYIDENRRLYDLYSNGKPAFVEDQKNLTIDELLAKREKGELSLDEYIDLYMAITGEYNHLKNNGKI